MSTFLNHNSEKSYRGYFFVLLFLAFAAAIIGDNAAEALLLSKFNADIVARLFAVNAGVLFLFSIFGMSVVDKFNRAKLYFLFLIVYSGIIILSKLMIDFAGYNWLFFFLYTLAYSGKIMMFFFVWTLANDVVDGRSGVKDFPIIASGGTIGAILTTFLIPQISAMIATKYLLILWLMPIFLSLGVLAIMIHTIGFRFSKRRIDRAVEISPNMLLDNLLIIKKEPVLSRLSIAYFIIFFLIFNQQFLFYKTIESKFNSSQDISLFLGYFNGIALIATLLLQTTVAGEVTKRLGSMRTLFILPTSLAIAFLVLLIGQTFIGSLFLNGVIVGVALRIAVFDSFFSPNYQNLFSTLPEDIRGKSKLAIDGIVKPIAMVLSSIWIILFGVMNINMFILFLLSLISIFMLIKLKNSYVSSLISLLSGYQYQKHNLVLSQKNVMKSGDGIFILDQLIRGNLNELKDVAILLLVEIDNEESINHLFMRFTDDDDYVKISIVENIYRSNQERVVQFLEMVVTENHSSEVIAAAIWSLGLLNRGDHKLFITALESLSANIRANGLIILYKRKEISVEQVEDVIGTMLISQMNDYIIGGLWVVSNIHVHLPLKSRILDLWYKSMDRIITDKNLWKSYVSAVISIGDLSLIAEILHSYVIVSEISQKLLVQELVSLCESSSLYDLMDLRGKISSISFSAILKATVISRIKPNEKESRILLEFAHEEYKRAMVGKSAVIHLRAAGGDSFNLLATAIEDEEVAVHFVNLALCAAISDRSGKISRIIAKITSNHRAVRSQVLEVVDSLKQGPLNKLLIDFLDPDKVLKDYFHDSREVISHYINSSIPIVQQVANYANEGD